MSAVLTEILTEIGKAARERGTQGFIPGLAPSLAGEGRGESAGSLQSDVPWGAEAFPEAADLAPASGITINRTEAQVPRPLQPRLTPLFLFWGA